jgi:uroporphyrin-III C-methyltransferase
LNRRVFLIGAGPGDPDLLTVKAHRILQTAEVIIHDSLVSPRILALAPKNAELIDAGKRCGKRATAQTWINAELCRHALRGAVTVRLKGGDPMIFGRADEELAALDSHGIDYEIVPGITAAAAAAASLKISLTKRNVARSLHIVTGHGADGNLPAHDWVALAARGGTLAVYMGAQKLSGIAAHLIESGMKPSVPAVAIENVSLPDQKIIRGTIATLSGGLARASFTGPVLILIGEALSKRTIQAEIAAADLQTLLQ